MLDNMAIFKWTYRLSGRVDLIQNGFKHDLGTWQSDCMQKFPEVG
jgi:hypothetical protein